MREEQDTAKNTLATVTAERDAQTAELAALRESHAAEIARLQTSSKDVAVVVDNSEVSLVKHKDMFLIEFCY